MTKRQVLLVQASVVVALGAIHLLQPEAAHAASRAQTLSGCGVCISGLKSPLNYCLDDLSDQNAACSDLCPGSLGTVGDCGTTDGDAGCTAGDIGFSCV
jgi:hypothetical protein